jgi:hypothetical protein
MSLCYPELPYLLSTYSLQLSTACDCSILHPVSLRSTNAHRRTLSDAIDFLKLLSMARIYPRQPQVSFLYQQTTYQASYSQHGWTPYRHSKPRTSSA